MRTLLTYTPLLLCPALMVVCLAGSRLWGHRPPDHAGVSGKGGVTPRPKQTGVGPGYDEVVALRSEVARLRSMPTPRAGTSSGGAAGSAEADGGVERD
jgi:hypothetical protein